MMAAFSAGPAPAPAHFEHKDVSIGGVRLHYVDGGSGELVVNSPGPRRPRRTAS